MLNRLAAPAAYGLAGAGVLALVAMMAIVTYDVVLRYFFNDPTVWAGEVASFLTIAVVFLGLGQNMRQGDHIRIDVITRLLSPRMQLVLDVLAQRGWKAGTHRALDDIRESLAEMRLYRELVFSTPEVVRERLAARNAAAAVEQPAN